MREVSEIRVIAERLLAAWNTQDVEQVVAAYTADVTYRDPNTRGEVRGAEPLRHYLRRLFSEWQMSWTLREVHPFSGTDGAAVLWHATFRRKQGGPTVEADGMDLAILSGDLLARNEVYFDRSVLAQLRG